MKTPRTYRIVAAVAAMLITFSLLSGVAGLADPATAGVQMAHAAPILVASR